jgi:hypothetical protein
MRAAGPQPARPRSHSPPRRRNTISPRERSFGAAANAPDDQMTRRVRSRACVGGALCQLSYGHAPSVCLFHCQRQRFTLASCTAGQGVGSALSHGLPYPEALGFGLRQVQGQATCRGGGALKLRWQEVPICWRARDCGSASPPWPAAGRRSELRISGGIGSVLRRRDQSYALARSNDLGPHSSGYVAHDAESCAHGYLALLAHESDGGFAFSFTVLRGMAYSWRGARSA